MLSYFGSETGPDEVAIALYEDGAAVVEHVVPQDTVAHICSELKCYMPRVPIGQDSFFRFEDAAPRRANHQIADVRGHSDRALTDT